MTARARSATRSPPAGCSRARSTRPASRAGASPARAGGSRSTRTPATRSWSSTAGATTRARCRAAARAGRARCAPPRASWPATRRDSDPGARGSAHSMTRPSPFEPLIDAVESAAVLDEPGKAIAKQVRSLVKQPLKDVLAGTWLGHALHPLMTDVVISAFLSTTLLDLAGGDEDGRAGERLLTLGIAAYAPTALSGVNDWADTEPVSDAVRRTGLVHAASNATALAFYAGSLAARRRGARGRARLLSVSGATALMAGGFLGGHLSLAKGVGPDQTVFDPGPTEWTPAADASQLRDGQSTRVVVGDTPVLLLREGDAYYALHDRCSHRGCSLTDGTVEGDEIVCACHGSRFDRRDGSVRQGPATAPQPAFQTRISDDRLEVRRLA